MIPVSRLALMVTALLFFAAPGHPAAWFHGIPLGLWGLVVLAVVAFSAWVASGDDRASSVTRATAVLAALIVVKVMAGAVAPPSGWLGRYYANGRFGGEPRRSTEFVRLAGATRIDRAIDFRDDYLPLYFLNEADFNRGIRREVTEPVTVAWTGHVRLPAAAPVRWSAEARGMASVSVDGTPVLELTAGQPVDRDVTVGAGDHVIEVRYSKPANTDPLVRVIGPRDVMTAPAAPWRLAIAGPVRLVARAVDMLALFTLGWAVWVLLRGARWSLLRVAAAAMFVLFVAQGALTAAPLQRRAVSLSGGDDWMAYEARSRAVATGDPLMLFGQPPGKGDVLYYYPGYTYFLAGVHALGGEDQSTLVFVHFLLLFGANVLVYQIGARLFDRRVAMAAVLVLVAIEELAFIRHYTVTLLSENLYFFTIAAMLYAFVRFAEGAERRWLVWCAIAGGVSALTRPAMMLYYVPAALIVLVVAWHHGRHFGRAAAAMALFAATWLAAVSPATIRNYVAAGSPVLICEAPAASFINYNLPPNVDGKAYRDRYSGTVWSLGAILGSIVLHYPLATLQNVGTKIGFSLGMVQWMGGNVHPELVVASLGYLLAIVFSRSARAMPTWPIHAFVVAHLAGMVLTMPSNYGYRLILPMYLFFPMFGARVASDVVSRIGR